MNAENFTYWLQGFFELTDTDELTEDQVKTIKDHLALVFQKVTPDRSKKKAKKPIKDTGTLKREPSALETAIAINPEQARLNIEEAFRKRQEEERRNVRVTCDTKTYPSPTRWVGGGIGQKYC